MVENQVPIDTFTSARAAGRSLVFGHGDLQHRADTFSGISDSADSRPRTSCLDEDSDGDRSPCCLAAKRTMVPRNQPPPCGVPTASDGQDAYGHADMESQQVEGSRIQRLSDHDTRL